LSYHWWPMAKFINDNTILVVNWSYSNSTSKHLNRLHRAIPEYYRQIAVKSPCERYNFDKVPHEINVPDFLSQIKQCFDGFSKSKKYKSHIYNSQSRIISNMIDYCNLFNLPLPDYSEYNLDKDVYLAEICKQEEHIKLLEFHKETERLKLIESLQGDLIKLENLWLSGESNQTSINVKKIYLPFSKTRLRAKNDNIETSKGAKVTIREAKILYDMIQRQDSIKGHRIGNYTVIGLNGTLKIGCHEIERDEITRIAKLLNW
jgi:hypothetical protein